MKPTSPGFRVAVVGASSLLGQELITVLEERQFPMARLVKFETEAEEPDLPILDLQQDSQASEPADEVSGTQFDFIFLAAAPPSAAAATNLLRRAAEGNCAVIDLISTGEPAAADSSGEAPAPVLRIPSLERAGLAAPVVHRPSPASARVFLSAHPAAMVISSLLLRLAARFRLRSATAHIFAPVSEMGSRAVEELQKQSVNLMSFQKPPQTVFGAQLAFNVLPRWGHARTSALTELEKRIRVQTRHYLADRVPPPALRLVQVPVFYSLAFSLYVQMAEAAALEAVSQALQGEHIRVRKASQPAPSQVEAAGSNDILIDALARDAASSHGVWIWATADNLRLAAVNAVEIAESLRGTRSPARVQW
jgi:aspartate-semialdehyde dehydrogenase